MFIDELSIVVRSGAGGRGCESYFRRADHKKVPNGGDGGDGGDVVLKADPRMGNLFSLRSRRVFEAERGGFGIGHNRYGRAGKDCVISIPCGTTVYNKQENLLIRDLVQAGEEVVVLKGGMGGYGNHSGRPATRGEAAKELELLLSFKIIADIFLVGLPNSGKTALLKRLTNARVSATDYPFATKSPQLGTYQTDFGQFVLCELPSIYEASESGRGLGTRFLKHLERARLIFFMLDPKTEFASDLRGGYDMLLKTMEHFNPEFMRIPRFLIVNKTDLVTKKGVAKKVFPASEQVYFISTLNETGLDHLMNDAESLLGVSCGRC